MKIKITENKYLNALLILILFSATVHMLALFVSAAIHKNLHMINYFNILDLNYFIPNFLNNSWGDIVSFIFVAIIYLIILKTNKV